MSGSRWRGIRERIDAAWREPKRRAGAETAAAVDAVLEALDRGELRVAEPPAESGRPTAEGRGSPIAWKVNVWIKQAILLYFALRRAESVELGPFAFRDKIPLKSDPEALGIRVVPPATLRYGSFLEPGVVAMPSYVNLGAYVGSGTMIDTWATVGSCAQIGSGVHLSGGVGIGGVLEPMQAAPVIVEDGAFIGSRSVVVEGVRIGREAVLGAGVILTASTPVVDARSRDAVRGRGYVPPRSVVIPATMPKRFPAGVFGVPCALIIGERKESTDAKTALNEILRESPNRDFAREREDETR